MIYKYQKIQTQGANGTTIVHSNNEESAVCTLGQIGAYTYISALSLIGQSEQLNFIETVLTDEEKENLIGQRHLQFSKQSARNKIRSIKDIEDDLTDTKMLVQFLARGLVSTFNSQAQNIKDANIYKDGFEALSSTILTKDVRLDLEENQIARIIEIISDEETFANIVQEEYKGKMI